MKIVFELIGVLLIIVTFITLIKTSAGWIRVWDFPRLQIVILQLLWLPTYFVFWEIDEGYEFVIFGGLGIAMFYHIFRIFPYTQLASKEVVSTKTDKKGFTFSLLLFNVYMENKNTQAFLDLAEKHNPDIVLIVEPNNYWANKLKSLEQKYEYSILYPLENTYGILMYSKLEIKDWEIKFLVEDDVPSIHTYVVLPSGEKFKLYFVHPRPPSPKNDSSERDAEILIVAKLAQKKQEACIVTGDLNDVAWSHTTRLFRRVSGLKDPRIGRFMLNTFNSKYPIFRWPLDHFFLSGHFELNELQRLPHIGSDHFPLLLTCTYNPQKKGENVLDSKASASAHKEADQKIENGTKKD